MATSTRKNAGKMVSISKRAKRQSTTSEPVSKINPTIRRGVVEQSSPKSQGIPTKCLCPDCSFHPSGTLFVCEDGILTPIAPPQGPTQNSPWILIVADGVNQNLPYWESLSNLLQLLNKGKNKKTRSKPKRRK